MSERRPAKSFFILAAFAAVLALNTASRGAELRDPTLPPAAVQAPSSRAGSRPPKAEAPDWKLSSILVAPDRRVAVISGQALAEGDSIDGARVVEISPAEVLLRRGKREYTLKLTPDRLKVPSTDNKEGK